MSLTQINIVVTDNTCTTSLLNLELHGNNMGVLIYIAKYRVFGCKVPRHIPWIDQMNTPLTYKEQSEKNGPRSCLGNVRPLIKHQFPATSSSVSDVI